jgi:hypothetical protein
MKSTALLLSLSLFSIPACSKKVDKGEAPEASAKTVEAASALVAETAIKVNPKLEALSTKFDPLYDRLDELDYKLKGFEKEVVATYGPMTATATMDGLPMKLWIQCDSTRCVGATLIIDEDPTEVSSFDAIDEMKEDGNYHGPAYLAWRTANPEAKTKTTMSPKELTALYDKLAIPEELSWDAAIKQLQPAGKSVKYPEDEDYQYWHALSATDCVAVGIMKYQDEEGAVMDGLEVLEYEATEDPLDNSDYARCAMFALGL